MLLFCVEKEQDSSSSGRGRGGAQSFGLSSLFSVGKNQLEISSPPTYTANNRI